jgi:hypothetical protein
MAAAKQWLSASIADSAGEPARYSVGRDPKMPGISLTQMECPDEKIQQRPDSEQGRAASII